VKRIEYSAYGGPEVMRVADFEPRHPGAGEVRVSVKAAAINPVDWKIRKGDMAMVTGRSFPRAMGLEFSGVVEAVGHGTSRVQPGDAVYGVAPIRACGSFAEMLVTKESLIARKPDAVSFETAACLSVAPVAAWCGLVHKARLGRGQRLFVAGCAGAVGSAAVQFALQMGAQVEGSCRSEDMSHARQLGVTSVVDYASDDLRRFEGRFDVVFDASGKLAPDQAMPLLVPGGGMLLDLNFSLGRLVRDMFLRRYGMVVAKQSVELLELIGEKVVQGKLKIQVGCTASLEDAIGLITDVEGGAKVGGRAVIVM